MIEATGNIKYLLDILNIPNSALEVSISNLIDDLAKIPHPFAYSLLTLLYLNCVGFIDEKKAQTAYEKIPEDSIWHSILESCQMHALMVTENKTPEEYKELYRLLRKYESSDDHAKRMLARLHAQKADRVNFRNINPEMRHAFDKEQGLIVYTESNKFLSKFFPVNTSINSSNSQLPVEPEFTNPVANSRRPR